MKLPVLIFLFMFSNCFFAQGQAKKAHDAFQTHWKCNGDTAKLPLCVVENWTVTQNMYGCIINPKNIKKVDVYRPTDNIAKAYGRRGENGVIKMVLRDSVKLINLSALLSRFAVNPNDTGLKVCVNENLVAKPADFLADPSAVLEVKIIKNRYWDYAHESKTPEKFINIVISKPDKEKRYELNLR